MAQAALSPAAAPSRASFPMPADLGLEYQPRSPEEGVVHQVVVEYLESFLEEARRRDGTPFHVVQQRVTGG